MGMMGFSLEWTKLSARDYRELDGSQRLLVDKALDRIRIHGMNAGQPLSGSLAGCRKLKHLKSGLRIDFRRSPDQPHTIKIIIGRREGSAVYSNASSR